LGIPAQAQEEEAALGFPPHFVRKSQPTLEETHRLCSPTYCYAWLQPLRILKGSKTAERKQKKLKR